MASASSATPSLTTNVTTRYIVGTVLFIGILLTVSGGSSSSSNRTGGSSESKVGPTSGTSSVSPQSSTTSSQELSATSEEKAKKKKVATTRSSLPLAASQEQSGNAPKQEQEEAWIPPPVVRKSIIRSGQEGGGVVAPIRSSSGDELLDNVDAFVASYTVDSSSSSKASKSLDQYCRQEPKCKSGACWANSQGECFHNPFWFKVSATSIYKSSSTESSSSSGNSISLERIQRRELVCPWNLKQHDRGSLFGGSSNGGGGGKTKFKRPSILDQFHDLTARSRGGKFQRWEGDGGTRNRDCRKMSDEDVEQNFIFSARHETLDGGESVYRMRNFCVSPRGRLFGNKPSSSSSSLSSGIDHYRGRDDTCQGPRDYSTHKSAIDDEESFAAWIAGVKPLIQRNTRKKKKTCFLSGRSNKLMIMPLWSRSDSVFHMYHRMAKLVDMMTREQQRTRRKEEQEDTLYTATTTEKEEVAADQAKDLDSSETSAKTATVIAFLLPKSNISTISINGPAASFDQFQQTAALSYAGLASNSYFVLDPNLGEGTSSSRRSSSVEEDNDDDEGPVVCFEEASVYMNALDTECAQMSRYRGPSITDGGGAPSSSSSRSGMGKQEQSSSAYIGGSSSGGSSNNIEAIIDRSYSSFGPRSRRLHGQMIRALRECVLGSQGDALEKRSSSKNLSVLYSHRSKSRRLVNGGLVISMIAWFVIEKMGHFAAAGGGTDVGGENSPDGGNRFLVHEMGDSSISELVRLYNSMDVVIGTFGSGLLFSTLMPPGSSVMVEIAFSSQRCASKDGLNNVKNNRCDYGGDMLVAGINHVVSHFHRTSSYTHSEKHSDLAPKALNEIMKTVECVLNKKKKGTSSSSTRRLPTSLSTKGGNSNKNNCYHEEVSFQQTVYIMTQQQQTDTSKGTVFQRLCNLYFPELRAQQLVSSSSSPDDGVSMVMMKQQRQDQQLDVTVPSSLSRVSWMCRHAVNVTLAAKRGVSTDPKNDPQFETLLLVPPAKSVASNPSSSFSVEHFLTQTLLEEVEFLTDFGLKVTLLAMDESVKKVHTSSSAGGLKLVSENKFTAIGIQVCSFSAAIETGENDDDNSLAAPQEHGGSSSTATSHLSQRRCLENWNPPGLSRKRRSLRKFDLIIGSQWIDDTRTAAVMKFFGRRKREGKFHNPTVLLSPKREP